MKALDVLVVDDEEAAREIVGNLVRRSGIEIASIRYCANLPDAVSEIKLSAPDVAFLDINIPDYAGYEIGKFFPEIPCEIIFVTAYDNYAIKAFELSAVDYLVKPLERSRLNEALEKLVTRLNQKEAQQNYEVLLDLMKHKKLDKIVVSELTDGQIKKHIIPLDDLVAMKANGAYTELYLTDNSTVLVSKNIKHMESKLPEDSSLMRSHRSWIINLNHVVSYMSSQGELTFLNDIQAKVSKACKEAFEERVSLSL